MELERAGLGLDADNGGTGSAELGPVAGALQVNLLDKVDTGERDRLLAGALEGVGSINEEAV